MPKYALPGVTFLEVLLSIAIFSGLTVLVVPLTIRQIQGNKVESAVKDLTSIIYTTQQDSFNAKNDAAWGISFSTNSYTRFSGDSLASATSQETLSIAAPVSIASKNLTNGSSELVFTKGKINPQQTGDIVLSDGAVSYRLQISNLGLITIQRL